MAKPTERVQLIKWETTAGGGDPADDVPFPEGINADEDAIDVAGVAFQASGVRDTITMIWRDGNDMMFEDSTIATTATLAQLLANEITTVSNVGLSGVGLFDSKVGVDLQFKNIDTGSNKLSITNNVPNKTVDLDVVAVNVEADLTTQPRPTLVSANDTTAGYLFSKIVAGDSIVVTELNNGSNETLEIAANITETFSVDYETSATLVTTSSSSPQDAFAGVSVSPPVDGDYVVFFDADCRVTNSNGKMGISIGLNSTSVEQAGSLRQFEGNDRGSNITIFPLVGLTTSDTIHGLFRKVSGAGTAEVYNRSMLLMRIG